MGHRILFYTNAFDGGGAEIVFARLAVALAEGGHSVTFAADHAPDSPIDGSNVNYVRLPSGHAQATRALAALLRAERPDASFSALGAHNLKHVAAAAMSGRLNHCVLGIHGFAAAEPKRMSRLSFWATPILTRLAARTICVSDILRDHMVGHWRGSAERLVRIYNPVAKQEGVEPTLKDTRPLVLACGRLVPIKRFPDLIAAFANVVPKDARLVILGEGPERHRIEAVARELDIAHRVDLPGHVDPSRWYTHASCLVVTSASESFGLTIAEALARGVPVVSTDCGGPREILADGRFGRLVSVGDTSALTRAINDTLANPSDPAPLLDRAKEFAIDSIRDAYAGIAQDLSRAGA